MAHGMGRVERGWRGGCCPGPCSGSGPWAAGRAGPRGHPTPVMPGCVGTVARILPAGGAWAGQHLWASPEQVPHVLSPVCKGTIPFLPFPSIPASGAAACLTAPAPQVGTACASSRGSRWRFLGRVSTWKWVQAVSDPPYLHAGAHPAPAVPRLLAMPTPAGRRSALRPAQIYPLFYIHTPLIFTALLEQYPELLITPAPLSPPPPVCIHHAPTKVPSGSRGQVSAGMSRLVWWHPAL